MEALKYAPWQCIPAGRQQLLAEQRLLEAEAAAEAQRLLERQQEELEAKKRDSFKRAAESGVTAGEPHALPGLGCCCLVCCCRCLLQPRAASRCLLPGCASCLSG